MVQLLRLTLKLNLQQKIMMLTIGLVSIVLLTAGVLIAEGLAKHAQTTTAERAMAIAKVVAEIPSVQQAILSPNPSATLQPFAERWRKATGAAFIVISNMQAIRLSHPIPENVGTPMADLYREPVLQGQEFVYVARGSLDVSLRANVPIFHPDTGVQIGFVSVGFYLADINQIFYDNMKRVLAAVLVALIASIAGAAFLARNVKQAIFGLEPHEIATLVKERTATLDSIREGVVAVDVQGRIRVMNHEASNILQVNNEDIIGHSIQEFIPDNKISKVMATGEAVYDEELCLGQTIVLANCVPIIVEGQVKGAVITFRERTEVTRLAEELTGVHQFVDILRAQAHEFKNKLHTISGLIQLERYDEAIHFATDSQVSRQGLFNQLSGRIRDSVIFGLLLGKASYMREKGVDFTIDPDSCLEELPVHVTSGDIVLILGNLLQNSLEAVTEAEQKAVYVCIMQSMKTLSIIVQNTGPWIDEQQAKTMYQRGFTTKQGGNGLGLALIAEKLQLVRGTIRHSNLPLGGVQFEVSIPY